jgi:hypothetical protein
MTKETFPSEKNFSIFLVAIRGVTLSLLYKITVMIIVIFIK